MVTRKKATIIGPHSLTLPPWKKLTLRDRIRGTEVAMDECKRAGKQFAIRTSELCNNRVGMRGIASPRILLKKSGLSFASFRTGHR